MNFSQSSHRCYIASFAFIVSFFMGQLVLGGAPAFSKEPIFSPNSAQVSKVVSSAAVDVVVMDGGLEQGLRLGMVCAVSRGFQEIGELIIIESRSDRSAGLILELANDSIIQAGDIARVKSLQTS